VQELNRFWSWAVRWGQRVDWPSVALAAGGYAALEAAPEPWLLRAGVAASRVSDWRREVPLRTAGCVVTLADPAYPARLRALRLPPPALFYEGRLEAAAGPAVGIVGTRRCSARGAGWATHVAGGLAARGVAVVSGLARGIDAAAHRAAAAGGRTIAVLGHGLGTTAPPTHVALRRHIVAEGGLVATAFPDDLLPRPFTFPARNAWIVGLSAAVVVVEAGARSGALITARLAAEEGREVFVLPPPEDRPDAPVSRGCAALLADGAHAAPDADALLRALTGVSGAPRPAWVGALCDRGDVRAAAELLGTDPAGLQRELARLELSGAVVRLPTGRPAWTGRSGVSAGPR
jgi:DNA processing protein